ncbi:hypothetical protein Dimus_034341 [Dionaea muscipula]
MSLICWRELRPFVTKFVILESNSACLPLPRPKGMKVYGSYISKPFYSVNILPAGYSAAQIERSPSHLQPNLSCCYQPRTTNLRPPTTGGGDRRRPAAAAQDRFSLSVLTFPSPTSRGIRDPAFGVKRSEAANFLTSRFAPLHRRRRSSESREMSSASYGGVDMDECRGGCRFQGWVYPIVSSSTTLHYAGDDAVTSSSRIMAHEIIEDNGKGTRTPIVLYLISCCHAS